MLKLWQHARSIGASGSIQVTLQPRQQQNLYDYYKSVFENPDDDSDSATTLRSGIVAVRIMVVLTVLRHWSDKGAIERLMQVHDDDYHNAMALSERLRGDTEFVMNEILHGGEHGERSRYEERHDLWYEKLPMSFTTKQAVAVGEHVGIKKSTIHKLLRDRPDIEKLSHGNYRRKAPPSGRSP